MLVITVSRREKCKGPKELCEAEEARRRSRVISEEKITVPCGEKKKRKDKMMP